MGMRPADPWPNALSLPFVEERYAQYLADPASVGEDWRGYFDGLDGASPTTLGPSFRPRSVFGATPAVGNGASVASGEHGVSDAELRQDRVDQLIRAYRVRGHLIAQHRPARPAAGAPTRSSTSNSTAWSPTDLERQVQRAHHLLRAGHDTARDPHALAEHLLPLDRRAVHAHRRPRA